MGEARRRGTREERIAQSVARKAQERDQARAVARAWWAGLTEEEREAQRAVWRKQDAAHQTMRELLGFVAGVATQEGP